MTEYKLKDIDPEDIEDVLKKVEASFSIKFADNELSSIKSFGELCDHITNKIQLADSNDCTSQQAYYKLRNAIATTIGIDKKTISPNTLLTDLLPRRNRHYLNSEWEKQVGFKLNILRPPNRITITLAILLLASLVTLFFHWQTGLSVLIFSMMGIWIANKLGKEFDVQTIGEVAQKMTRENYLKSRRNPEMFNKNEIEDILIELFSKELLMSKAHLSKDAEFVQQ